jgi:predicted dehydrogenase
MKIAIIGCGKIADQHVQAIERISKGTVVAVCDREPLMAAQLSERFGISNSFDDVDELLVRTRPDVVHITTPPQSHLDLACRCLRAGAHVYVEKPFTVTAREANEVIECARATGRLVTAGHNYQFTPEMIELRALIAAGYLGGMPVHLESHWSYDLGDVSYVAPLLGSPDHWVQRLPGQLMHNLISHGVARIAEFMADDIENVVVLAGRSAVMHGFADKGVDDELRVLLRDSFGVTAEFCFTTQVRPAQNTFRVFGRKNSLLADINEGSLVRLEGRSYKSYLTFVMPQLRMARQYCATAFRNVRQIARWRLYQDSGMTALMRQFYESVESRLEPPIPYREIVRVAEIMDRIFDGCRAATGLQKTGITEATRPGHQ